MPRQVVILHGWSDKSESFHDLRAFLAGNGFEVTEIWLGDYISMDDDVRVSDVSKRMQAVLQSMIHKRNLSRQFDLIVHSTGGLVARDWVARYYPTGVSEEGDACPVKRIVMLAPANFGSRLAAAGKSFVGRVTKGFDNWFHTGTEMLRGLELASPYQWDLARRDLLDPDGEGGGPYGGDNIWPFVITGGRGYTKLFMRVANEDGADGTVRACAANMNCIGLTIDFASSPHNPRIAPWSPRNGRMSFPFVLVPDRNHSTIVRPAKSTASTVEKELGDLILEALNCQSPDDYQAVAQSWAKRTEDVARLGHPPRAAGNRIDQMFNDDRPPPEAFHQYMQVIVAVVDDQDQPVDDYFLEFYAPTDRRDDEAVYFQSKVLEHVHVNTTRPHLRCLYIDRTDLMFGYYPRVQEGEPRVVAMSLSAAPIGKNIRYFASEKEGASGSLVVHREDDEARGNIEGLRLRRNMTHLVKIIIPRQPRPAVFKLSQ